MRTTRPLRSVAVGGYLQVGGGVCQGWGGTGPRGAPKNLLLRFQRGRKMNHFWRISPTLCQQFTDGKGVHFFTIDPICQSFHCDIQDIFHWYIGLKFTAYLFRYNQVVNETRDKDEEHNNGSGFSYLPHTADTCSTWQLFSYHCLIARRFTHSLSLLFVVLCFIH